MKKIFESEFYKELEANPKPYTIPYMKEWGEIITYANKKHFLEKLMVDYLLKKDLIMMYYEKYEAKRSDFDQLDIFEKDINSRIGKKPLRMEFFTIVPDCNIKEQFEKILTDSNFVDFLL